MTGFLKSAKMLLLTATCLALSVATTQALADEQWYSNYGDVIYQEDYGSLAVLSFPGSHPGRPSFLYVVGLGGNYDNRGQFDGAWLAQEEGDCGQMLGDNGVESSLWGRATVTFRNSGYPSSFNADLFDCHGEYFDTMKAEPY